MEQYLWECLQSIADREHLTVHDLATMIYQRHRNQSTLTSAIRIFIMAYFRAAATENGHATVGHGRRLPLVHTPFEHLPVVNPTPGLTEGRLPLGDAGTLPLRGRRRGRPSNRLPGPERKTP
jgi:predicted DNA-binding ribbon-helix-helix protein